MRAPSPVPAASPPTSLQRLKPAIAQEDSRPIAPIRAPRPRSGPENVPFSRSRASLPPMGTSLDDARRSPQREDTPTPGVTRIRHLEGMPLCCIYSDLAPRLARDAGARPDHGGRVTCLRRAHRRSCAPGDVPLPCTPSMRSVGSRPRRSDGPLCQPVARCWWWAAGPSPRLASPSSRGSPSATIRHATGSGSSTPCARMACQKLQFESGCTSRSALWCREAVQRTILDAPRRGPSAS